MMDVPVSFPGPMGYRGGLCVYGRGLHRGGRAAYRVTDYNVVQTDFRK
jgi:hypothetical protein